MKGTVYLVGAGPGAADLLTLRAARLLEQAEIVFHDALVDGQTLALAQRAVLVAVGKRCGKLSTAQRFINKQLIDAAARTGADLVIGERQFRREAMPGSRYYANLVGSRVLSWFVGSRVSDTQCGFRVYRLDALRDLTLTSRGYEIETEMLIKLRRRGARVTSVPVTAVYASERSRLRPVRDTTKTCFLAVYYQFLERL